MKPLLVAFIAAATCMMAAGATTAQQARPTFRAAADVVTVEASVKRERRPVIGLTAADFEVLDNGVAQEISDVSYEKLPIDLTVILDVSASVSGAVLDQLRRSVGQLRADLGPRDRLKLMTFNMRVRRLIDFDQPGAAGAAAFAATTGYGSSGIFDALAVALAAPESPGRRHLVVLFTDGQDSSSISDPESLLNLARRTTPTVTTVLPSAAAPLPASVFTRSAPAAMTVRRLYERIASETGGSVVMTTLGDNLSSTFRRALSDFRSSYVLYFTPKGVERTGSHTLEVRVRGADVEVRARRGYVW